MSSYFKTNSMYFKTKIIIAVIGLILVGTASYLAKKNGGFLIPEQVACTMEAKLCPDGSAVGRSGPNCEFAACPGETGDTSMKTFVDSKTGISFSYPVKLSTKYTSALDWPPKVQMIEEFYSCSPAGSEIASGGKTERRTINGRGYCRTTLVEGAAGSTYRQYAYAFAEDDSTIILTFSLVSEQCGNYDLPQKTECEAEKASFNIDPIIGRMAENIKFQ